jgi:hypothetical protein
MFKDLRGSLENPLLYFKIIDYHEELADGWPALNVFQLMDLVGTEIPLKEYHEKIPDKYITQLKLKDFNFKKLFVPTKAERMHYPWGALSDSIKIMGMIVPVIAERYAKTKEGYTYLTTEGKHRVPAVAMIKPFDPERPIPALVVEYDPEYTYIRHTSGEKHIKTMKRELP